MAQATDYNIANQSGANFRSELNTILAAVVSQNSGSTEPTTTYAYQLWIDTGVTPALLKIRNGANSAFITVGDVTAANLGLLSVATAASTYAPIASPTFTGTVTIPSGASITGYLTTATATSTYLPFTGGALTGNITLNGQSDLRFADLDSSNWVAFQAPASVASNVTWTLPATDAAVSGSVLVSNAAGTLSWSSDYATAAQGTTADSAVQPGDNISDLTNDSGFITSSDDITGNAATATTASTANALNTGNDYQVSSLGVGTAASGTAGEIRATNDITAYYSSDINLKKDVELISEPIEKLKQIRGVAYSWNEEYLKDREVDGYFVREREIGVIAQEVEGVLPEIVATREDGYKAVRYERLVALLVEAVKQQQEQIDELKAKLEG